MGVLDRFRGGGGGEPQDDGRGRLPIEEVRRLSQQEYSESEITETLRDRGYSYSEINEAMNQAVQQQTVQRQEREPQGGEERERMGPDEVGGGVEGGEQRPPEPDRGRVEEVQEQASQVRERREEPQQDEGGDDSFGEPQGVSVEEEELIETIVAEHFTDVEDEFNSVYRELDSMSEQIEQLQDRVEELEIREDEDEQEFMQKIDEMEDYLQQSQSRIGGMEKAFEQVLPSLVENTRELSSLVKDMKEEE